ncbi:Uncharacterised protein [Neisseria animaloris]|nr:hypothetical protein BWD08_09090 [Neisseria animaloris]VEH88026.1 Uncharacterised protein [Neisseria animaloris]
MNYIFFFICLILSCLYFICGVIFFKGYDIALYFSNFDKFNQYVLYGGALFLIIVSKPLKYLNIKILNKKISEGNRIAIIIQNYIGFLLYFIMIINLISFFWFVIFNFS